MILKNVTPWPLHFGTGISTVKMSAKFKIIFLNRKCFKYNISNAKFWIFSFYWNHWCGFLFKYHKIFKHVVFRRYKRVLKYLWNFWVLILRTTYTLKRSALCGLRPHLKIKGACDHYSMPKRIGQVAVSTEPVRFE